MEKRWIFLLLVLGGLCYMPLSAQDGHYWTEQYGTKSMLLSGAVIGGVEDLGAIFYNPARLGLIENPAFLLSADVYEWQRLRVFNATDETGRKSNSEFGGVPSMVAGSFRLGFLEGHQFAYGILQRLRAEVDIYFDDEASGVDLPNFPEEDYFFQGSLDIRNRLREDWFALAWSYPFSQRYSIGITMNGVRYSQRKENLIDLHANAPGASTSLFSYERNYRLNRYGLLWKIGFAAAFERLSLGLTVTTPVVGLWGKGKYDMKYFTANIPDQDDLFVTTDQKDLTARYKRPWSVGAGITYRIKQGKIHLSAEWFDRVRYYDMLEAEDHLGQSDGETYSFTLYDDLKSVVNAGIGLEYAIGERLSLYGSFATDFSVVDTGRVVFSEFEPTAASSSYTADLFHVGGGFILNIKEVEVTLGVTHTGGWETFDRIMDFPEDDDSGPIFPEGEEGRLRWSRWRIVFGFQVPFLTSKLEQLEERF